MVDPSRADPLTAGAHKGLIAWIASMLTPDAYVMVIGGGLMMESGIRRVITTKDEDVVLLLVVSGSLQVADVSRIAELVRALGSEPTVRKDQTSVSCTLGTDDGRFFVEFVRGRRAGGGYFVSRAVLERVAARSAREGRVLVPPLEALAFLKAWAAVDKAKLVRAGKDGQGYHAARERAFRDDVQAVLGRILDVRQVDGAVVDELLEACGRDRAREVRRVLIEAGWPFESDGGGE